MLALLFITAAPANAMRDGDWDYDNGGWHQADNDLDSGSNYEIPPTPDWKVDEEDEFFENFPEFPNPNDKSDTWGVNIFDGSNIDENTFDNGGGLFNDNNRPDNWNQGGLDEELYDHFGIPDNVDDSDNWTKRDEELYDHFGIPDNVDGSDNWTKRDEEDYNNFINQGASKDEFLNSFSGDETLIGTISISAGNDNNAAWYGMDGKKLSGMPTETGMYINNGQQVYLIIE